MGLKSNAAVIQTVCPLILDARRAGFSHRTIHSALCAAGLNVTWNNYRIALGRATSVASRKLAVASRSPLATPPANAESSPMDATRLVTGDSGRPSAEARLDLGPDLGESPTHASGSKGTSGATRVIDALRQAREVAISKDYAQIARDLYRQNQRNRRTKDPS